MDSVRKAGVASECAGPGRGELRGVRRAGRYLLSPWAWGAVKRVCT